MKIVVVVAEAVLYLGLLAPVVSQGIVQGTLSHLWSEVLQQVPQLHQMQSFHSAD